MADPARGQRVIASRGLPLREAVAYPVDEALAAALGAKDAGQVRELVALLEPLARRFNVGAILRHAVYFDAAYSGTPPWDLTSARLAISSVGWSRRVKIRLVRVAAGWGRCRVRAGVCAVVRVGGQ